MGRTGIALQLLAIAVLAWALNGALREDTRVRPSYVAQASTAVEEPPAPAPFSLASLQSFSQTLERPLFTADRRPPVRAAPAPARAPASAPPDPAPAPEIGPFILSAIVIVDDEREVLLSDPREGRLTRRREGETVDGWTLEEIREDAVILRYGDQTRDVLLRRFDRLARGPGGAVSGAAGRSESTRKKTLLEQQLQQKMKQIQRLREHLQQIQSRPDSVQSATDGENCGLSRC